MFISRNSPVSRQQAFASAISSIAGWPIRPVMYSRCLSAVGIRFLRLPAPAVELGLPCGRLTKGNGRFGLGQ